MGRWAKARPTISTILFTNYHHLTITLLPSLPSEAEDLPQRVDARLLRRRRGGSRVRHIRHDAFTLALRLQASRATLMAELSL